MAGPMSTPSTAPPFRPASEVLTLRHGLSWMMLACASGAVNAGAFLACDRFVTHVTGTQIGRAHV